MLPSNIPVGAVQIKYKSLTGQGNYYIWKSCNGYIWSALGQGGFESTFSLAGEAARNWIRNSETRQSSQFQIQQDSADTSTDS